MALKTTVVKNEQIRYEKHETKKKKKEKSFENRERHKFSFTLLLFFPKKKNK